MEAAPAGSPPSAPEPFEHQGIIYGTVDELVDTATPVLRAGVDEGEYVVALVEPSIEEALRNRLGAGAEAIEFTSPDDVLSLPAQTMVAARRRRIERLTGLGASPVTMLGQHQPWTSNSEAAWWDAAFNVVLEKLPVTLLCACPAAAEQASRVVRQTHPRLRSGADVAPNPGYRDPVAVLTEHPPGEPPDLGPCTETLPFSSTEELAELRSHTRRNARATGLPESRVADLVLAVSELAANSIEHGGGHGTVRVWREPCALTIDVCDPGRMSQPLPGLRPPPASCLRGRGLWLGRELCDVMHVWHAETGTGVRVRIDGAASPAVNPGRGRAAG
jgi:anti-sigma regulatory factor (Ser/Thr protein kinase)